MVAGGALLGDVSYVLIPGASDRRERRLARRILAADQPGD
jgi:hypothetical protein